MSAASPLAELAASANDLSDFLAELGVTPAPERKTRFKKLVLPKGPNPAAQLRRLLLPEDSVENICKIYDERITSFRRAVLGDYDYIGQTAPKIASTVRLGFKQLFTQTAKDLCKTCVDSASDALNLMAQQNPESRPYRPPFNKAFTPVFEYIYSRMTGSIPTEAEKKQLAKLTKMSIRQIDVWFQNKRARMRKKVREGKPLPRAPTLEETLDAFRLLVERDNTSSTRLFKKITFKRKRMYAIEEEKKENQPCARDLYEEKIRLQYERGVFVNPLDEVDEPEDAFPAPFESLGYDMDVTFPAPQWDRLPRNDDARPYKRVSKEEIYDLADHLERVQLFATQQVMEKRQVTFLLPLPQSLKKIIKERKRAKAQRKAARARAEAEASAEDAAVVARAVAQAAAVGNPTQEQPQAQFYQAAAPNTQVISKLCNRVSGIRLGKPKRPKLPVIRVLQDGTLEDAGTETSDDEDDKDEDDAGLRTPRDLMEILPSLEETAMLPPKTGRHPAASFEPYFIIEEEEDQPQNEFGLTDEMMQAALRKTLQECGYDQDLQIETPETRTFTKVLDLAPQIAAPVLAQLDRMEGYEEGPLIPLEAHVAQGGYDDLVDPYRILVDDGPEPLPPAAYERSQPLRVKKQRREEIADIGGIPISDLFDPQGMPLPLALLEAAPYTTPTAQAIYDYCMPPVKKPRRRDILPPAFPCNPYFPVTEPSYHYPFHPVDISSLLEPLPAIQHVEPAILAQAVPAVPAILAEAVPTVPAVLAESVPTVPAVILADPADLVIPAVLLDDPTLAELVPPAEAEPAAPPTELAPEPGPSLWPESDPELDPEPADDWTMLQRVISWACKRIIQTTTWDVSSTDPLSMLQYLA